MHSMVRAAMFASMAVALPMPGQAWDYPGHRIVGAIADRILEQHHPATRQRVMEKLKLTLPGGEVTERTLREVAVFPDCAKRNNEPFCGRPPSDEEQHYTHRNPHHGKFHFTDVPLQQPKYGSGGAGTDDLDVVQMIGYAVAQLRGHKPPAKKDVELSDTEAVWLLTHLVGDIHQPLHVGAQFFDQACENSVDPNVVGAGLPKFGIGTIVAETVGGNLIFLVAAPPAVVPADNLHFYWDGAAVARAMQVPGGGTSSEGDFAQQLAGAPPAGWETAGEPETWAGQWATEILPLAREAHERLTIRKGTKPAPFTGGCTWETSVDATYEDWAKEQARTQLAKAGFRLAALLRAIFGD